MRLKKKQPKTEPKVEKPAKAEPTLEQDVMTVLENLQIGHYSSKEPFKRTNWGYDLVLADIKAAFKKHGYKKAPSDCSMALDDLVADLD